ncbi:hypothetical protein AABM17_725 [Neisseria musculi]|uniref:Uncharacterized protein n=1 Tax=Neisseria musculi TaxID=1815583 RepID=A0A7H1M949_9NEIS|nr:hypothetical protein H7A79_0725 [Neisseria musculi]
MSLYKNDSYDESIENDIMHADNPRNIYYGKTDIFGDPNTPWTTVKVIATVFKLLCMTAIASYVFFSMTK